MRGHFCFTCFGILILLPFCADFNVYSIQLGEGSFGVVSLGVLVDGRFVAVKQVGGSAEQNSSMYNEAKLMLTMKQHKNIIQVFGLTLESDKLAIVMEFAALGSLESYVERVMKSGLLLPHFSSLQLICK